MRTFRQPSTVFAVLIGALLLVLGCTHAPARSVIQLQADGLRTFTVVREIDGAQIVCPAFGLTEPLSGVLRGDPSATQEKLILDVKGRRVSVVWPAGFSLRFVPQAVLFDDHGSEVGHEGGVVTLDQVAAADHAGSFEDPYIAQGSVFGGCYPFTS
jgi:hypothetical protein